MDLLCEICNSKSVFWKLKNGYKLFICSKCGFGFVHPKPTQDQIEVIYSTTGHGEKYLDNTLAEVLDAEKQYPNSSIDSIRLIKKLKSCFQLDNKSALDIGAGYGFYSLEMIKHGFEVTPLEIAKNERKILNEMTGLLPVNSTFENFDAKQKYGVILMSQILEHAADPVVWTQKTFDLLDKDGLWVIAVPHFNSWSRYLMQDKEFFIIPPEHLNYFTKKSISILLENHGFEILEMETFSRLPWHKIPIPRVKYPGNLFLKLMDTLGLGMMLNIVARKK